VMTATVRQQIADMLRQPRTASSIAQELKLSREDVEDHLRHLLKTARAADQDVRIEPARCRSCGHTFSSDKFVKPGKCPECKGTRLYEPLIQIKG
jgi:predicted Zn-ribbon and HTH transcriptional regulator